MVTKDLRMTVFKYRDKWRAEVYVNGRRIKSRSGFQRERDANAWHDQQVVALRQDPSLCRGNATFDDALAQFELYHLPTLRIGTRKRYELDIRDRIKPFFRFLKLEKLTPQLFEAFKLEVSKTLKPKSVNNCLHTLRLILNKAVKYGLIPKNPYCLDSVKVPKQRYRWWDQREDIAAFLSVAKTTRYYGVYLLALETGMRYGEIVGLSKSDIDFERGIIHIHRQWHERHNCYGPTKGGEERFLNFDPSSEVGQQLRRWVKRSPHIEAVFTTGTGQRCTKSGLAEKYFKAVQRRAKVPVISFHDMRHTFASWYMRQHKDIWALKHLLGHKDIKTTMRYAHHAENERQKPLDLASVLTHKSLTGESWRSITSENREEKSWRDGRDLKTKQLHLVTPSKTVSSL